MRTMTAVLLAILMTLPLPGSAQTTATPGDRVRVQSRDGAVVVGTISRISPDSIIVHQEGTYRGWRMEPSGSDVALPVAEVARIELSLGRQRRFARNFWRTVAVSSAAVGLIAAATWQEPDFFANSRGGAFALGACVGAIYGVPVGVIVGLTVKSERWAGTKVSVAPVLGPRLGLVGSISLGGR